MNKRERAARIVAGEGRRYRNKLRVVFVIEELDPNLLKQRPLP